MDSRRIPRTLNDPCPALADARVRPAQVSKPRGLFELAAVLLIAPAIAAFPGCDRLKSSAADAATTKPSNAPGQTASSQLGGQGAFGVDRIRVRAERPVRDSIASYLETTCNVAAFSEVEILPKVSGVISEIFVEENSRVTAGQVLARIDALEFQIQQKQAEIALAESERSVLEAKLALDEASKRESLAQTDAAQAKRDFERDQKLSTSQDGTGLRIVAPKVLEASKLAFERAENNQQVAVFTVRKAELAVKAAETNKTKAEWALKLANLRLSDTEIRAPFQGVITARHVKVGETALPTAKSFKITDLDRLEAVFYRSQRDLRVLSQPGQDVIATSEAITTTPTSTELVQFNGKVKSVSPIVDPQSGSFKVTATLDNKSGQLRPGLLVRVRVTLGLHENVYLVPKRARILEGDKPFVFVVRNGTTVRIPIEEGYSDAERIEVLNIAKTPDAPGLRADDDVVVIANVDLKEGLKVVVENAGPSGG